MTLQFIYKVIKCAEFDYCSQISIKEIINHELALLQTNT